MNEGVDAKTGSFESHRGNQLSRSNTKYFTDFIKNF